DPAAVSDATTLAAPPDVVTTKDAAPDATGGVAAADEAAPVARGVPPAEPLGQPICSATIANTGGQGAECRAAPDVNSPALAVFGDGNRVDLRGGDAGGWTPVNCAGAGGYISSPLLLLDTAAP